MSNQLSQENQNEKQSKDEVDKFVNSTGDFARLPQRDGETALYQFFNDKSKRELTTRTFEDPVTHEKTETRKVKYKVLVPDAADQEKNHLSTKGFGPANRSQFQQESLPVGNNKRLQSLLRRGKIYAFY